MKSTTYYVLADTDSKGRVIGYNVCFWSDGANTDVENGYFPSSKGGWKVALVAANALRDELNKVETSA